MYSNLKIWVLFLLILLLNCQAANAGQFEHKSVQPGGFDQVCELISQDSFIDAVDWIKNNLAAVCTT